MACAPPLSFPPFFSLSLHPSLPHSNSPDTFFDITRYSMHPYRYDWSTLQAKFPGEVPFGNPGCRALAYTYELLVSGYKFPADSMNVRVVDTLNGQNVEWTLGALIYYLSYEEWAMGCSIFDSSSGVAIGLAFGFVTLFLVGALVYLLMCKNSTQKMHADDDGTNNVSLLESEQLETVSFR
jgi:hypothetical protein